MIVCLQGFGCVDIGFWLFGCWILGSERQSWNDSLKSYHITILFLTIHVSYHEVISRYANDTALSVVYITNEF